MLSLDHRFPYFVLDKTSPRRKEQDIDQSDSDDEPLQRFVDRNEKNKTPDKTNTSDEHRMYQEYITQRNEEFMINDRERQAMSKRDVTEAPEEQRPLEKRKKITVILPTVTRGPAETVGASNEDREAEPQDSIEALITPEYQDHDDWDGVPLGDLDSLLSDEDSDDGDKLHQISQVESE